MKDDYLILEVPRDATKEDIRSAHRRLLVRYRPGKRQEIQAEEFGKIQEAYEVLSDSAKAHGLESSIKSL